MKPTTFAIRGTVCFSTDSQNLTCLENAFIVCQDGRTVGVFPELPAQFEGIPVEDVGDQLIIPGMNDLHITLRSMHFTACIWIWNCWNG